MNRITTLLQKLSDLYLQKIRDQHLQQELQAGDINLVLHHTRAAYSELLEWQRTMHELESMLMGSRNFSEVDMMAALQAERPAPKPAPVTAMPSFDSMEELHQEQDDQMEPAPRPRKARSKAAADERESIAPVQQAESFYENEKEEEPVRYAAPKAESRVSTVTAAPKAAEPRITRTSDTQNYTDIRELINANDKFLFVSELFNHNRSAYEKSMEAISKFRSRLQATNWVNALIKKEYKWKDDSEAAQTFYGVIDQFFASK